MLLGGGGGETLQTRPDCKTIIRISEQHASLISVILKILVLSEFAVFGGKGLTGEESLANSPEMRSLSKLKP